MSVTPETIMLNDTNFMKYWSARRVLCLAVMLLFSFCLPASGEDLVVADEETMLSWPFISEPESYFYLSALDADGQITYRNEENDITFMSGPVLDTLITDECAATAAAYEYAEQLHESLDMQLLRTDRYKCIICYSFQVMDKGMNLANCFVKIITDESGRMLGVASSLPENTEYVDRVTPDEVTLFSRDICGGFDSDTYETQLETTIDEVLDISVPVLVDPDNGNRYLGDNKRRIYCVDASTMEEEDSLCHLMPICLDERISISGPLITYFRFIQVYDYFLEKGWSGPDGLASPCILMIDFTGEQNGNASYDGFQDGCHFFYFGTEDGASQSIQVIAHEFMHGVSSTNHIGRYVNETGALNESISDMIGNAVEADIRGTDLEHDVWLQCFKTSHQDGYPMFVWDAFYAPSTDTPSQDVNDLGDVHHSSNIVSMLAYRQAELGMTPGERFDYWFLFDLTLTPVTDFAETMARAAWCAEIVGMSEYAPAMLSAVYDLRLNDRSVPEKPYMDHHALVCFDMTWDDDYYPAVATFYNLTKENDFSSWPAAGTNTVAAVLEEGDYVVSAIIDGDLEKCYLWTRDGWIACDQTDIENAREEAVSWYCLSVGSGHIIFLEDLAESY